MNNINNLYHSPESLRSPFRRINSIDTPKQNRYKKRSLLEATKQMSNSPDSYEVTSSLDDTREGDISALEKSLIETSLLENCEEKNIENIKKELLEAEEENDEINNENSVKVEVLDELELNDLDEDSHHSWTEPVLQAAEEEGFVVKTEVKTEPVSGRTTPDHEIQPPLKKGRGDRNQSFRTAKNNTKRDFTRKTGFVQRETDETTLKRRQKQIDYGKVSVDYEEYLEEIPIEKRNRFHPRTPDKLQKTSRRSFDSQIKNWKISIHKWREIGDADSKANRPIAKRKMPSVKEELN
jgi:hypothetical protein